MHLSFLRIKDLRNLRSIELTPSLQVNWIVGGNGAGKTAILEAIYLLARGFSFRGNRQIPLINEESQQCLVFSKFILQDQRYTLAIEKTSKVTKIKLNRDFVTNLEALIKVFPISIITPESHELLQRGPAFRRKFLDWSVFHVEHGYKNNMKKFKRILSQRNQALKKNDHSLETWNLSLIESANEITQYRRTYFEKFKAVFIKISQELMENCRVDIDYNQGWPDKLSYEDALKTSTSKDIFRKFTHYGPHKADINFTQKGKNAIQSLSRGQQKMLIFCLYFSQMELVSFTQQTKPILLIDDLPAELDAENKSKLLLFIRRKAYQSFISSIFLEDHFLHDQDQMFHVEHGYLQV